MPPRSGSSALCWLRVSPTVTPRTIATGVTERSTWSLSLDPRHDIDLARGPRVYGTPISCSDSGLPRYRLLFEPIERSYAPTWAATTVDYRGGSHDDRRHAKWRPSSTSLPAPIARHANDHCASLSWWWRRRRYACTFCERWSIGVRGTRRSPRGRPRPSRRATCRDHGRSDGAFADGTLVGTLSPLRDTDDERGPCISLATRKCPVARY